MLTRLTIAMLAAPLVAAATPTDGLPLVKAHLAAVESMTADFVQTDRTGKSLSGVLTLKKPAARAKA